jgi:hypothetical protein
MGSPLAAESGPFASFSPAWQKIGSTLDLGFLPSNQQRVPLSRFFFAHGFSFF